MSSKRYRFKASILQNGNMNAAYVEFPFSVEGEFGKKGHVKVKVLLDKKVEYRGSLAKMGYHCHILGLTQAIRKELNKSFDDEVNVELWEDFEERIVEIPQDVQFLFNENLEAFSKYEKLSYTHRKEYMQWIEEAKKEETREKRKIKMIEMLLAK
jgi:hypothetical protein